MLQLYSNMILDNMSTVGVWILHAVLYIQPLGNVTAKSIIVVIDHNMVLELSLFTT